MPWPADSPGPTPCRESGACGYGRRLSSGQRRVPEAQVSRREDLTVLDGLRLGPDVGLNEEHHVAALLGDDLLHLGVDVLALRLAALAAAIVEQLVKLGGAGPSVVLRSAGVQDVPE